MMKLAYDLHTANTTILQKRTKNSNDQLASNNIHQLYKNVFSGRGLCEKPIPRPEDSYRVCMCH